MEAAWVVLFVVGGWFVGEFFTLFTILIVAVVWAVLSRAWIKSQGLEEMSGGFFVLIMGAGWGALVGMAARNIWLYWPQIAPTANPILDLFIRR